VFDRKQLLAAHAGDPEAIVAIVAALGRWLGQPPLAALRSALHGWSAFAGLELSQVLRLIALCALLRFAREPRACTSKLEPTSLLVGTAARWATERLDPLVRRAVGRFVWRLRGEFRRHVAAEGGLVQTALDELVHDVTTKLLVEMKLARWDPARGSIQTFVWAMAVNTVIDRLRIECKQARIVGELSAYVDACFGKDDERIPPIDLERFKTTLSKRDQAIYVDYYEDGLTAEEIAVRLGMTLANVQYRIYRIGQLLRQFFGLA